MTENVQILQALERSPVFGVLAPEKRAAISRRFTVIDCPRGSRLSQDRLDRQLFLVVRGRFERLRTAETGRELSLRVHAPGDVFSLLTLLDGEPHLVETRSLDDALAASCDLAEARAWLVRYPELGGSLLRAAARHLRDTEELAAELTFCDTATRLARAIVDHIEPEPGEERPQPGPFVVDLSQDTLARMIGSVRLVVSRHVQELKKAGIVEVEQRGLIVRDLDKLKLLLDRAEQISKSAMA